jgi:uncharacterized protein (TIGR02145 family)
LYDWNEAMGYVTTAGVRGICPPGWHVPTEAEFQTLSSAVGGNSDALKAVGQGSGTGINSSGFSALLAGYRNDYGNFSHIENGTYYRSSSEYNTYSARYINLRFSDSNIYFSYGFHKEYGFSIRCLKD